MFTKYGRSEIPEIEGCEKLEDDVVKETLDAIWLEYGKYSAYDLVELTCSQTPWKNAIANKERITSKSIKQYFQSIF